MLNPSSFVNGFDRLRPTRIFTTLKTHKKKSIFFALCLSYGALYNDRRQKSNAIFRTYCQEAERIGAEPSRAVGHNRRILVVLNRTAKNGKCRAKFEKYAEPLLHLAGLEVELAVPSDDVQTFEVAKLLDTKNTDAVFVVGGDGTVSQVVNGLMKQVEQFNGDDNSKLRALPPLAVFPGGFDNHFVQQYLPVEESEVRFYCNSAMSLIKGSIGHRGVIKVQLDESEPIYAAQMLQYGDLPSVEQKKHKYWYWGGLKRNFSFFRYCLFNKPDDSEPMELTYTEPCHGCSNCVKKVEKTQSRWWHGFVERPKTTANSNNVQIDYSTITNENCGQLTAKNVQASEILIINDRKTNFQQMQVIFGGRDLKTENHAMTRQAFLKEALQRGKYDAAATVFPSKEFVSEEFGAGSLELKMSESERKRKIAIDGDWKDFNSHLKLTFIPRTLQYFHLSV